MSDQSPMDASTFVTDAFLQSVLQAAADARQQCLQMLDFIDQNRAAQPDPDAEMRLSRQQKLLHSNLAKLRGLNRRALLDTRNTKQQTQEAKSEIDSLHLHLQNLYYEQRHLIGDIAACQGYKCVVINHSPVVPPSNMFTVTNTNLYL
jgi:THO complex subunit 5